MFVTTISFYIHFRSNIFQQILSYFCFYWHPFCMKINCFLTLGSSVLSKITNPYPIASFGKEDNHIVQRFKKYAKYNIMMSYRVIYTFALLFIPIYLRASWFSNKLLWLHISKFFAPCIIIVFIFLIYKNVITKWTQYKAITFSQFRRIILFIVWRGVCACFRESWVKWQNAAFRWGFTTNVFWDLIHIKEKQHIYNYNQSTFHILSKLQIEIDFLDNNY